MYKKSKLKKEVGIAIKSKETSNQFESVRNSYVAIMHQPVTILLSSNASFEFKTFCVNNNFYLNVLHLAV